MPSRSLTLALLTCALAGGNAHASSIHARDPLISDFALDLQRTRQDVNYGSQRLRLTTERVGVSWHERLTPRLDGGLLLGYAFASQDGRPPGQDVSGYYAGVVLRGQLYRSGQLGLSAHTRYLYHRLDRDADEQRTVLSWHQAGAGLDLSLRASQAVTLLAGSSYRIIDGEERLTGDIAGTSAFEEATRVGYYAGLEIVTAGDGRVGARYGWGAEQGAALYFQRHF